MTRTVTWLSAVVPFLAVSLYSQQPDAAFFESKIRPVLASSCYSCHSSKLKAPMGALVLDTKAGLRKGGATGAAIVPGNAAGSRLLQALKYTDRHLQMPPAGKLADGVIANFEQWIAAGAPDPRVDVAEAASAGPLKGMSVEDGRKWWAFQPVRELERPKVTDLKWSNTKIDAFVLAKLEEKRLEPSPRADIRTLVRRAYVDLVGFKPTYEEVEEVANDSSPNAYERLIERLLASTHYGERWGRHWLDVARYAEDNPTSEATNPPYPFAWRYRDWVIQAVNDDVPFNRFVKLQLAADLMPGTKRDDLRALGYLGAAPIYHKDQRLSEEVIYTFLTDDWDERVDAVTRGLLGLTVACARCHDHKFDPIPTKDYYGLAGVFASTMRSERPLFEVDKDVETRYMWAQNRLFDLRYSANLLTNEASTVDNAAPRVEKWKAEIAALKTELDGMRERYPDLVKRLDRYLTEPVRERPAQPPPAPAAAQPRRRMGSASTEPFINAVYDAAQYVDGTDANYTFILYKPGEARDLPVLLRGSVTTPGEITPRHFPAVLTKGDGSLRTGSGRLELAEKIFDDAAPLTARVIVNRVWSWHFGRPLVGTPSDFGTQGDKPTHPELLTDLSARFISNGWSLKWLHREIMLSATYQQSSRRRPEGEKVDQINAMLWKMNPRRMDVEAYRDSILRSAGSLSSKMYGVSEDLDSETNTRRTIYGRISRGRQNNLLKLYDFPDASQTSPSRDLTTTPLQQLFVMNGTFVREQAGAIAKSLESETDQSVKVKTLYRKILSRDATPSEIDLALTYLAKSTVAEYAEILLSTNEVIYWP